MTQLNTSSPWDVYFLSTRGGDGNCSPEKEEISGEGKNGGGKGGRF